MNLCKKKVTGKSPPHTKPTALGSGKNSARQQHHVESMQQASPNWPFHDHFSRQERKWGKRK
jgi:hypothetical protein